MEPLTLEELLAMQPETLGGLLIALRDDPLRALQYDYHKAGEALCAHLEYTHLVERVLVRAQAKKVEP